MRSHPDYVRLLSRLLTVAVLIPLGIALLVAATVADMPTHNRHVGYGVGTFLVCLGVLSLYSSVRRSKAEHRGTRSGPGT